LWLDLEQLLALPLDVSARAELWRLALDQQPQGERQSALPLVVALARHHGQLAVSSAADGEWEQMQEQLKASMEFYEQLIKHAPERAELGRREFGNLIGKLVADLHGYVYGENGPQPDERSRLCWYGYELTQLYRRLQLKPPDWLYPLEEQLVRKGSLDLYQMLQSTATDAASRQKLRRQALELLLQLGRLHHPCPRWILIRSQQLLSDEIEQTVSVQDGSSLTEASLQFLLGCLARLPLADELRDPVQLWAQRGIWSLQLLAHSPAAVRSPVDPSPTQVAIPEDAAASMQPAPTPSVVDSPVVAAVATQDLLRALSLSIDAWLADHPAGIKAHSLAPAFLPGRPILLLSDAKLSLNLASFLDASHAGHAEHALGTFFRALHQSRPNDEWKLADPYSALWSDLIVLWQGDQVLSREQFVGLARGMRLWCELGGEGGLNAEMLASTFPTFQFKAGQGLVRPGAAELAALQTILLEAQTLSASLAEIRRRHHDRDWMMNCGENWLDSAGSSSENLRRLHALSGFYASGHSPLESLQRWSQGSLRGLLGAELLVDEPSVVRLLPPVAQQLIKRTGQWPSLVQWPGDQAFYDFIAGQEVLFVTPLAAEVEGHHRTGLAFELFVDTVVRPYGLRCVEAPDSTYPNRPDRGFEYSLDHLLAQVERFHRQKPFSVFVADCGAYSLPLCSAVQQRYGVSCISIAGMMNAYFGVLSPSTQRWRASSRRAECWISVRIPKE